jgi:hypothetical protein
MCGTEVLESPRYPRYLCERCVAKAVSAGGRPLTFFTAHMSGGVVAFGFAAFYADTGEPYPSHECFVDGIRCRADEAYMGGIVVEVRPRPPGGASKSSPKRKRF